MTYGLILMTALPPTRGHEYLINFASYYMQSAQPASCLYVIVCSRDCEPISGKARMNALEQTFLPMHENVVFVNLHGEVPQDPSEHPDFWNVWKGLIHTKLIEAGLQSLTDGIVFASDSYGADLARALQARFIPCDTRRDIVSVSATRIRHDPLTYFDQILPTFQPVLQTTVTLFGAESTGKTTLSKRLAVNMNGHYVHEWAREYMEACKIQTVDDDLMTQIIHAQWAVERSASMRNNKPFVFRDTDLLSTIGYYQMYGYPIPAALEENFARSRADLYILTNDMIPFTPDALRFGGHKRETANTFWLGLLREYNCNYHLLHSTYQERQEEEVTTVVRNHFLNKANGLGAFLRTNQEPLRRV